MLTKVSQDWIQSEIIRLSGKENVIQCQSFNFRFKNKTAKISDTYNRMNRPYNEPNERINTKIFELVSELKTKNLIGKSQQGDSGILNDEDFKDKIHKATITEAINLHAPNLEIDLKQTFSDCNFIVNGGIHWSIIYYFISTKFTCVSLVPDNNAAVVYYFNDNKEMNYRRVVPENIIDMELI